jgi:hypothetical protein
VAYDDCPTAVDAFCRREEVTTSVGVVGKVVFYDLEKLSQLISRTYLFKPLKIGTVWIPSMTLNSSQNLKGHGV